ncbi:unnamed protein product [Closterium sp. Yama58-4]|nr:unnamed protein product [Closterium sp. Yama58-4]
MGCMCRSHFSLVVALNLAAVSSGKRADSVTEGVKLVHYDSSGMHAMDPSIIDGVRKTLLMIHESQLPTDNPGKAAAKLREAEHIVIPKDVIPQQTNDKDCGVFVCMYTKYLVESDFTTVRKWVSCDGVTAKDFRRRMRADVCSLATGELIVQLLLEEIEVPLQPTPIVGDHGVLMWPKADDVRMELARMARERTNMELGGFVLASAVTSIAKALGYDLPELRAACAHELSTCGTPLLQRSSAAENSAERQGAQAALAEMLHETPETLRPVPAIWARRQQDDIGATRKARNDNDETHGPNTPDTSPDKGPGRGMRKPRSASAKATESAGSGEKKRGGTSDYTGVWFEKRVGKWCTKLTADPSTGRQIRLGAYQREEDAAYAYAAGAFVIRRKDTFPKVMELTAGEVASLEGCIEDDVRHLVHKRQWYRWREWRKAMDDIGIKPGTPFQPEKGGKSSALARRLCTSVDAPGEAADGDGESVEVSPGEGSDGEATEAPPEEPEPVSSDDNPNEALPHVNAAADDDADETNEERSDSAPVTREEFDAMRKTQTDTAATLARLETALLASLANHTAMKRKRDNARGVFGSAPNARKARRVATPEESDLDEDEVEEEHWRHKRSSTSPILQCALKFLPTNKGWKAHVFAISKWSADRRGMPFASGAFAACARAAFKPRMINGTVTLKLYHMAWLEHVVTDAIRFWEARKGRLSNSAGVNAQIVDGLRECALTDVMAAVDEFQPAYDATTSSWAWGRHGLRLSSCGIERQATAAPAASESGREGDHLCLN